ncbi:MAG: glycosyltransferase [Verrucomicrobia bacterium]|nr:glycosyltransferase [Verrucomicrobiota bacterium]
MSDPLISIILRSYNEAWALRETLPALRAQDYANWELIVIDSGSTDGSVELIKDFKPRIFEQITPSQYVAPRIMNRGVQLAQSNSCIFLNADATPQGTNWLRDLAKPLLSPGTAAVFGRQIPRLNCQAVYACDYDRCFGNNRESANWDHFFSMVSSGIRKDVWCQRGFNEKLQYAEDDEWTRWAKSQGYQVVYVPESIVMHSHNYTAAQAYKRSFGDARALAACWEGDPSHFNFNRTVLFGCVSDLKKDLQFCASQGRWLELPHAARIRWTQRRGKLDGFRSGWNDYRRKTNEPARLDEPLPAALRGRI